MANETFLFSRRTKSTMKNTLQLFILLITIVSCNSEINYYETPIENWLNKNLNDFSSYEPIEFSILMNDDDILKSTNFYAFKNELKRKNEVDENLIKELTKNKEIDTKQISDYVLTLSKIDLNSNFSINVVDSINMLLDKAIDIQLSSISSTETNELLDFHAQHLGASNRYVAALKKTKISFTELGTDLDNYKADVKNGLFVLHKYRAKNSLGALIIKSTLFKLDDEKKNVVIAKEI